MGAIFFAMEGSSDVWVADLKAGTVMKVEEPSAVSKLVQEGAPIVKGLTLAVSLPTADQVFSGHFDA